MLCDTVPVQARKTHSPRFLWPLGLCAVLFLLIWPVSPLSLLSLVLLAFLVWLLVLGHTSRISHHRTAVLAFPVYSVGALLLFHAQRLTLPEWDGLTGPEGIGTDDTYYYTQATGDYDAGKPHAAKAVVFGMHNYSRVMQEAAWLISFYKEPHLLDLLLLNAFALSFIPILCVAYVQRCLLSWRESAEGRASVRIAYWLPLLHPSLWSDGLVLIRDGWTAALFAAALLALLRDAYFRFALLTACLTYLRQASGVTLALCSAPLLWPVMRRKFGRHAPLFFGGLALFGLGVVGYAWVSGYAEQKGITFLRDEYVESFIGRAADRKDGVSLLYTISNLPIYFRVPVSFLFFLCAPFVSLSLVRDGIVIPRLLLASLSGALNVLLLKWWVQSLVVSGRDWVRHRPGLCFNLHVVYIVGIFLLSTMSLQMRHKTMLIPLLCVLAAHGATVRDSRAKRAGLIAMLILGAVNVANVFLRH